MCKSDNYVCEFRQWNKWLLLESRFYYLCAWLTYPNWVAHSKRLQTGFTAMSSLDAVYHLASTFQQFGIFTVWYLTLSRFKNVRQVYSRAPIFPCNWIFLQMGISSNSFYAAKMYFEQGKTGEDPLCTPYNFVTFCGLPPRVVSLQPQCVGIFKLLGPSQKANWFVPRLFTCTS